MKKKRKSKIGFDPLAWMNADASEKTKGGIVDSLIPAQGKKVAAMSESENEDLLKHKDEDIPLIVCPDYIGIPETIELKYQLVQALSNSRSIHIDVGAVINLHTSALQLFSVFMFEAEKTDIAVEWVGVTDYFTNMVRLSGMERTIQV